MNPEEVETLPPYSSPAWCDHGPIVRTCSRCDPSEASGKIRAREAREQAWRLKHHAAPMNTYSNPIIGESLVRAAEESEEKA